ncbi:MAG: pilin [bacterium]|nr:pilin [bacterium]
MIIKKIIPMIILSLFFLVPFSVCQAEDYGAGDVAKVANIGAKVAGEDSIEGLAGKVISLALSFVGIVFFILILYAGITWMTAMGNTEATTKSKNIIEAAVIGLVLVSAAYAISSFVFNKLDSSGGAGGGTDTADVCKGKKEYDICGTRKECSAAGSCIDACLVDYQGSLEGSCIPESDCVAGADDDYIIDKNLCASTDPKIICCHK